MLTGTLPPAADARQRPGTTAPDWHTLPEATGGERHAVVIGAGLAGCSLAYSLARRGWLVTVLETASNILTGASGTRQLALRCRLFAESSATAEFYLHSYLFASRQFQGLSRHGDCGWHGCGVLQLEDALNKRNSAPIERWLASYPEQIIEQLNGQRRDQIAAAELSSGALYFPAGGWIDPLLLCRRYLAPANISLRTNASVAELKRQSGEWLLYNEKAELLARSPTVIIANSHAATLLQQTATLPLQKLRGQTSLIGATASSRRLATVVCGQRSVFPALYGKHTVAASYSPDSDKLQASRTDDLQNLEGAKKCFQDSNTLGNELGSGNVAIRCTTPDRLPLLGMAPDVEAMNKRFANLARNANTAIDQPGCYLPGLYISVAHGSNGLATCPFASEYLASLICAESLPLTNDMAKLLNPARFLIKNLKQQRHFD